MKLIHKYILSFVPSLIFCQKITKLDSLRGNLTYERTSYDVSHYNIEVEPDIDNQTITGINTISFKVLKPTSKIQLDLFEDMSIDSIIYNTKKLNFTRNAIQVLVNFNETLAINSHQNIKLHFHGKPKIAVNAPWDGGWVFSKDKNNNPFIATAVENIGPSSWFPCKDTWSDEADSVKIKIITPNSLVAVSNGQFVGSENLNGGRTAYTYKTTYSINTYNICVNIGKYITIKDTLNIDNKVLNLNYYVINYNENKAREHFKVVKPIAKAFSYYFGEFPFFNDGLNIAEVPYDGGMEHQSCIAYGNKFTNGYGGLDYSMVGVKEDFILYHEIGHEWFGNSITAADNADMWIHEGFCTYAEKYFVQYLYGKEKADAFIKAKMNLVQNDKPVIPSYEAYQEGSEDMYQKAALLIWSLENLVNDTKKWEEIIKVFYQKYKHQIINYQLVLNYFEKALGNKNKAKVSILFNQYLKRTQAPTVLYSIANNILKYEIQNCNTNFPINPIITINNVNYTLNIKKKKGKINIPVSKALQKASFNSNTAYFIFKTN